MATLTGQQIGGFLIQEELGRGAMGVVFKARQLSMDRVVALKFLPEHLAQNEKVVARFTREARAAGKLSHPNIVNVHDVGIANGLYYIAMEFVDGASVHKRIRDKGPYSEQNTLEIARQVAEALKCAHSRGILHRDIKPDNFLVDSSGRVRLADLGLARFMADSGSSKDAELTQDGTTMGTPHYMSPEQCQGSTVDQRSDLYSLGASMFVMATGKTPYEGPTSAAIMVKVLTGAPRPLRELNPALSEGFVSVVSKLMNKDPAKRFQSAEELSGVLGQCATGQYRPVTAPQNKVAVASRPAKAPPSRTRAMLYGAVCALALLVLFGILSRGKPREDSAQKKDEPSQPTPSVVAQPEQPKPLTPATSPATPAPPPVTPDDPAGIGNELDHDPETRRKVKDLLFEIGPLLRRNPAEALRRLQDVQKLPLPQRMQERIAQRLKDATAAKEALQTGWQELERSARKDFDERRRLDAFRALRKFSQEHHGSAEADKAGELLKDLADKHCRDAANVADGGNLAMANRMLAGSIPELPDEIAAPLKKELERVQALEKAAAALIDADNKALAELNRSAAELAHDPEGKTGKPYRFADAAQVYLRGASGLKTAEAKRDAGALADIYTRASEVAARMRAKINDKTTRLSLPSLGRFKNKGLVGNWTDSGLQFTPAEIAQPQTVLWKTVTADDWLAMAKALKIGVENAPIDVFDLAALAFACGATNTASAKFTDLAAGQVFKTQADAALRILKLVGPASVPAGRDAGPTDPADREAAAKKLYDEALAAREKGDWDGVRTRIKRLSIEYAETKFVQEHSARFQQIQTPGPIGAKDKLEPEKKDDPEAGRKELKKLGWTATGEWVQDPKQKTTFSVTGGGKLSATGDKEVKLTFMLDEGAAISVFLRHEDDGVRFRRQITQGFIQKKIGPGYGVAIEKGDVTLFGSERLPPVGRFPENLIPVQTQTGKLQNPKAAHTVGIAAKEGGGVDVVIDGQVYRSSDRLRPEGDIQIIIKGNAKLDSLQFK